MFENYFRQIGSNILSSTYNGLISISTKSDNLITTFAFDKNMENPRATAVFTERIGIIGISNDDYETAASYTYKTINDSSRFRPTISFLQKQDDPPSIKFHFPYSISFRDYLSLKIFASDEITLNNQNDEESFNQTNNQNIHVFSLSGKATHRLFNGKITAEETMKILPQFFFASIINYSNIVLDTYLSRPIQQIKGQCAFDSIMCFAKFVHINRIKNPFKYNIGFIVTDPNTMLGFYFTQADVQSYPIEKEEVEGNEIEISQNAPEEQVECPDLNSLDIMNVFKIKVMHKQNNYKIASKLSFNESYQVIPKVGIEIKLNQSKVFQL